MILSVSPFISMAGSSGSGDSDWVAVGSEVVGGLLSVLLVVELLELLQAETNTSIKAIKINWNPFILLILRSLQKFDILLN
ncbi:hypothetical protein [Paenibacillus beijingensis]|uniref:hypothetical protein n=1 Tax=Paenibacillus beijingensis TaxID=1126833 RepID=UPI00130E387D|nr:hypothetical protein [Paenibacillus beijingensis]